MRKLFFIAATALLLAGCKANQAVYKKVYESAVATRDSNSVDPTIYDHYREMARQRIIKLGDDSLPLTVEFVSFTRDSRLSDAVHSPDPRTALLCRRLDSKLGSGRPRRTAPRRGRLEPETEETDAIRAHACSGSPVVLILFKDLTLMSNYSGILAIFGVANFKGRNALR